MVVVVARTARVGHSTRRRKRAIIQIVAPLIPLPVLQGLTISLQATLVIVVVVEVVALKRIQILKNYLPSTLPTRLRRVLNQLVDPLSQPVNNSVTI